MFFSNDDNSMKDAPEGRQQDAFGRVPHHYIQQQREYFLDGVHSSGGGAVETKRPKTGGGADANQDKALVVAGGGNGDGATIEMAKRPRGRPPGSKNKPKPPRASIVATPEVPTLTPSAFPSSSGGMRAHILEIPGGRDVAAALAAFSRRHGLGICVLNCSGAVANVTLRQPPQPSTSGSSTVTLRGRFDVLFVSATFLPPTLSAAVAVGGANELKVCLSGQQGRVLGGIVVGPLVTAGTLVVAVAAFSDPTVHQLPGEDEGGAHGGATAEAKPRQDEDDEEENVENDEGQAPKHQYQHGNYFYDHHSNGGAPGGLSIHSGHFSSDVLWQTSPPY